VSVFAPQQWYAGAAGATVTIPLTGWSVAPASNWLLRPEIGTSTAVFASILDTDGGGVAASGGLGNGAASGCVAHVALNDGTSATLSVTVPTAAQSGDYAVFLLESKRGDPSAAYPATCYPPTTEDYYHFWPVGLYVP
jgi:hypothetical protein